MLPDRVAALTTFVAALDERRGEADDFYKRYGVIKETWHRQPLPDGGMLVMVVTDLEDPSAFASYADSCEPFDIWFKERVAEISGVDLNQTPEGPPAEQIYGWGQS